MPLRFPNKGGPLSPGLAEHVRCDKVPYLRAVEDNFDNFLHPSFLNLIGIFLCQFGMYQSTI